MLHFSVAHDNTHSMQRITTEVLPLHGEHPQGKPRALLHEAEVHILTFSDGKRRVSEVESYQLSRELAKEAAGHGAIEEGALIAHSIHQCDGLGGIGRAHDLNDTGAKGKETCQIR